VSLTAKDVAEIIRLLEESSFDSLSIEMNGVKLNLQRGSPVPVRQVSTPAETSSPAQASASAAAPPQAPPKHRPSQPGLVDVPSPLLGVFYRAPKPGEPPFVEVGAKVDKDTVIGIIEVMKLMNSVSAGVKGQVVEILADNGALVEFGELLIRVRPGA
jgi:acetyl-CoA carboxylase biotin carboxyl carrier protein